jgi:hypothetical protein
MNDEKLVVLKIFPDEMSAQLVATELSAEGIESQVFSDDAGGAIPALQTTQGVRLMIRKEDEQKARELLLAMKQEGQ